MKIIDPLYRLRAFHLASQGSKFFCHTHLTHPFTHDKLKVLKGECEQKIVLKVKWTVKNMESS